MLDGVDVVARLHEHDGGELQQIQPGFHQLGIADQYVDPALHLVSDPVLPLGSIHTGTQHRHLETVGLQLGLEPGGGVTGARIDRVGQDTTAVGLLLLADPQQLGLLRAGFTLLEDSRLAVQQCLRAGVANHLHPKTAIWPSQQHVHDHAQEGAVLQCQRLLQGLHKAARHRVVSSLLCGCHGHIDEPLLVGRQHLLANVFELQEHRAREHVAHDANRAEAWCLAGSHGQGLSLGRAVGAFARLLVDILQNTMLSHEVHRGIAHGARLGRLETVFDHGARVQAPQQVEQIVGIAAHERPGQQQRLLTLAGQHTHGLPLSRTLVLVLVPFIHHQQPEIVPRQVAFDELGGLVSALPDAELKVGHAALHARGLPIREHQFAVLVHQVEELVHVVPQHGAQHLLAKGVEQLGRCLLANGGHLLQGPEHQVVHGFNGAAGADQGPQGRATLPAINGFGFTSPSAVTQSVLGIRW